MLAKRFRKKPVEIEAVHFSTRAIADFGVPAIAKWCGGRLDLHDGVACIVIPTLEGDMRADIGDWIIREPHPTEDRSFYPCKPKIFDATYEAVFAEVGEMGV